ncbi:MAG: glycosyltransferase family 2 protein [Coriobacteriia bacterium]|nr:glycosyltransferase family 2 protein [Coriobacteriia bacterium]
MNTAIALVLGFACVLVLVECALFARNVSRLPLLLGAQTAGPAAWPRVSVIIAARDEIGSAGAALATRLTDDYPNLEIVFVDDRSTDGTGDAVREAGAGDARLTVIRVDELPAGWLGKVHALDTGMRTATGEWLLFSDADVSIERGALRKAVAYALGEKLDMIALVPEFRMGSPLVDAVWADFMRALALIVDPRAVRDPRRRTVIGSGSFNLVRREALERTPGFEHLRLETGDDVALAQMVKQAGGSVAMVNGRGCASVPMYASIGELMRGVEKNGSSLAHRPFALVMLAFAALLAIEYSPIAATLAGAMYGPDWLLALGGVSLAATTAVFCAALWVNTRTWAAGLLWPIGIALMVFALARATYLTHRRGGVVWRDTFHSLEELEAGRRVTL